MANADPTGSGRIVAFNVPAQHVAFLRATFTVARDGVLGDLAERADQLRNPERSRREADVYGRLLAALGSGKIVPDAGVVDVLTVLARSIDTDNEYERVVFEHEALWGAHRTLARSACGGSR